MKWTREQDQVLFDYGSLGFEECRKVLHKEFGVIRSVDAIRKHASRIGAPVVQFNVCPMCGRKVMKLRPSGLCWVCHEKGIAEEQRAINNQLKDDIRRTENDHAAREQYETARKAYFKFKQSNWRMRRKLASQDA